MSEKIDVQQPLQAFLASNQAYYDIDRFWWKSWRILVFSKAVHDQVKSLDDLKDNGGEKYYRTVGYLELPFFTKSNQTINRSSINLNGIGWPFTFGCKVSIDWLIDRTQKPF